jgi:hypothetical protein
VTSFFNLIDVSILLGYNYYPVNIGSYSLDLAGANEMISKSFFVISPLGEHETPAVRAAKPIPSLALSLLTAGAYDLADCVEAALRLGDKEWLGWSLMWGENGSGSWPMLTVSLSLFEQAEGNPVGGTVVGLPPLNRKKRCGLIVDLTFSAQIRGSPFSSVHAGRLFMDYQEVAEIMPKHWQSL